MARVSLNFKARMGHIRGWIACAATNRLQSVYTSYPAILSDLTARAIPTAAVERAPSKRARSASKEAGRPSHALASHDVLVSFSSFTISRLTMRSSPRLRASNEGLLRPRVPRARRALLIASHSRHTPSQSNTAPPHRRTEGPDRAAYRRHPQNR